MQWTTSTSGSAKSASRSSARCSGGRDEVVPSVDPRGQLDAVALCLPPLDASEQVGAVFPRARGRGDADGPTVGKGAGGEGGRFQDVNLTSARNTVRGGSRGGSAGSRRRPPVCSPWWRLSPLTRRERRQPNILVIVTDDQRQGTMREMPNTRHFFFDEGRYFQRGFVTTPNCCPSRASIFSRPLRAQPRHQVERDGRPSAKRDGAALPARRRLQDRSSAST